MAVLNDYECKMHGHFEAFERKCPHGCGRSIVKLVFLKPVGTQSIKTKYVDRELNAIARDYKLTDIKAKRDSGTSCMTELGRTGAGSNWVDVPHNNPGWSSRKEKPAQFDLRTLTNDPHAVPGGSPEIFKSIPKKPTTIYRGSDGFSGKPQ